MTNENNDFFDYEYAIDTLFRSGEYQKVMNYLNGTERAISNLLSKKETTIEFLVSYLGFTEEYIKNEFRVITNLYDKIYNEYSFKSK